jgi:hypothetical protein
MQQINEAGLSSYVQLLLQRLFKRRLIEPFVRGTVIAASGSYPLQRQVQIQRVGEPQGDGGSYALCIPGYYAQVGDVVDIEWRDEVAGYVAYPLSPGAAITSEVIWKRLTFTSGAPTNLITIDAIPGDFQTLRMEYELKGDAGAAAQFGNLTFNSDYAAHYQWGEHYYFGGAGGDAFGGDSSIRAMRWPGSAGLGPGGGNVRIPNYSDPNTQRLVLSDIVSVEGTDATSFLMETLKGAWLTAGGNSPNGFAVNQIQISVPAGNIVAGYLNVYLSL